MKDWLNQICRLGSKCDTDLERVIALQGIEYVIGFSYEQRVKLRMIELLKSSGYGHQLTQFKYRGTPVIEMKRNFNHWAEVINQILQDSGKLGLELKGRTIERMYPSNYHRDVNDLDVMVPDEATLMALLVSLVDKGFFLRRPPFSIAYPKMNLVFTNVELLHSNDHTKVEINAGAFPLGFSSCLPLTMLLPNPKETQRTGLLSPDLTGTTLMYLAELTERKNLLLRDENDWRVLKQHLDPETKHHLLHLGHNTQLWNLLNQKPHHDTNMGVLLSEILDFFGIETKPCPSPAPLLHFKSLRKHPDLLLNRLQMPLLMNPRLGNGHKSKTGGVYCWIELPQAGKEDQIIHLPDGNTVLQVNNVAYLRLPYPWVQETYLNEVQHELAAKT